MFCLFCNQPVSPIPDSNGLVTCTVCDRLAIARRRLEMDEYPHEADGSLTPHGAWLRAMDEKTVK